MASPYQLAGARATLADLIQKSNLQKQQSQTDTTKKMGEMQDEFEKELEALQARARKRSKKNKLLGNVLNLVGLGLGPLGAGLTKGLSSAISLQDQKKGAEMLLDKGMQQKYGSNFLRRGMKDFTEQARDVQVSSGDVFRGALGSGLAGFGMSKALGGTKLGEETTDLQGKNINATFGSNIKNLIDMIKDPTKITQAEEGKVSTLQELQSSMMIPLLIQQILRGGMK